MNGAVGIYNSGKVTQHGVETTFAAAVIATPGAAGGCSIGLGSGTGNRTVLSPKTFLNVSGDYNVPMPNDPLRLNASCYDNSGFYHEPDNRVRQGAYSLVNFSASYEMKNGLSLSISVSAREPVAERGYYHAGRGRAGRNVGCRHAPYHAGRGRCMYHFLSARQNPREGPAEEDERIQARLAELRVMASSEQDGPMIAAQQRVIERVGHFRPMLLPSIDKGVALWRRRHEAMLKAKAQTVAREKVVA